MQSFTATAEKEEMKTSQRQTRHTTRYEAHALTWTLWLP